MGDLVLRPDLRTGITVVSVLVVATVGIITAILIGDAPAVFAPIVGTLFVFLIVLAIAVLLRSRIILTPHELIVRGPFYRQRRSRSDITEIVRATITAPRGAPGESLFLLDAHGNLLTRITAAGYKPEDVEHLLDALDVPCSGPDHPVSARQYNKTYPGLISRAERHPFWIAFTIVGVLGAVALALVMTATTP